MIANIIIGFLIGVWIGILTVLIWNMESDLGEIAYELKELRASQESEYFKM